MLTKEVKAKIIKQYGKKKDNSGTTSTQVALLTSRISYLTEHFKRHKDDFSAQKSLLYLVGKRKKLLRYLQIRSNKEYLELISCLNIRK